MEIYYIEYLKDQERYRVFRQNYTIAYCDSLDEALMGLLEQVYDKDTLKIQYLAMSKRWRVTA